MKLSNLEEMIPMDQKNLFVEARVLTQRGYSLCDSIAHLLDEKPGAFYNAESGRDLLVAREHRRTELYNFQEVTGA